MTYRGMQGGHLRHGVDDILRQVGHTAIWRQYISASDGIAYAGMGETQHYREQIVTALLYRSYTLQPEGRRAVGAIAEGDFMVSTRERLGRQDELIWRGVTYRVESDPQPNNIGLWTARLERGD